MNVAQSGDNESAVMELKDAVAEEIAQYSDDELKSVLKDYAIEDYESMDRDRLENYVLWLLAWDYADRGDE